MALVELSIGWLAMAIMGTCQQIPHSQSDIDHAASIAREVLPPDLVNDEFATVEASKCSSTVQGKDSAEMRAESFTFVGYFSNRSHEPDATIRDGVRCVVSRVFRERLAHQVFNTCIRQVKTLLQFDGVAREIDIDEEISLDHARQFLTYLAGRVGSEVDGEILVTGEFGDIKSVGVSDGSYKKLWAVYKDGCSSASFSVHASGDQILDFAGLARDSTVC